MKIILAVLILFMVFSLSGCSFGTNKKPYSIEQLTKLLEEKYNSKGRFSYKETIEENKYLFHDKKRGVDFTVRTWTQWNGAPLIPYRVNTREWSEQLKFAVEDSYQEQVQALAEQYGLKLHEGSIYISSYHQIENAAAFFCDIVALYDLDKEDNSVSMPLVYHANPEMVTGSAEDHRFTIRHMSSSWLDEGEGKEAIAQRMQAWWWDAMHRGAKLPDPYE